MTPETLPSIWPLAIIATTNFVVLALVGLSSARSRRVFIPLLPVFTVGALFVFGFFWTLNQVRRCTDCASTFSVASLNVIGTERVGSGVGGIFYSDVVVLIAFAVGLGLVFAVRLGRRLPPALSQPLAT